MRAFSARPDPGRLDFKVKLVALGALLLLGNPHSEAGASPAPPPLSSLVALQPTPPVSDDATHAERLGTIQPPVEPLRVVNRFDPPELDWHAGHRGVDLGAHVGQEVFAPQSATVHFVGVVADRPVLTLRLKNGDLLSFEPLTSKIERGASVAVGQHLGQVSSEKGHCSPDVCLHVGLRRGETYLNPIDLWEGQQPVIVLLPPLQ